MLLKNIADLATVLSDTPIAKSKLWHKDVAHIIPAQIVAFRKSQLIKEPTYDIDLEINYVIRHIQFAELDGKLTSPLTQYIKPNEKILLTSELIAGLARLPRDFRRAVLFGLEMKLSAMRVINLTRTEAHRMTNKSVSAQSCVDSSVISIKCCSVFWQSVCMSHEPLESLEEEVYAAFGMTWRELSSRYERLVCDFYDI